MRRKILFTLVVVLLVVVSIVLTVATTKPGMRLAGATLLGLTIAYFVNSFQTVKYDETGAVLFLEKPIEDVEQGLVLVPFVLFQLKTAKRTYVEYELPGEPEQIFQGEGVVPQGMVKPNRMQFGSPDDIANPELIGDPYNANAMVAEACFGFVGRVTSMKMVITKFGSMENFVKTINDYAVATIAEDLKKITPAAALKQFETINEGLHEEIICAFPANEFGIDCFKFFLKPFIFSHSLNKAVESVSEAREKAKAVVLEAKGKAEVTLLDAQAQAEATKIKAEAQKTAEITTGRAKKDSSGNIIELIPEANTRVQAERR